MLIIAYSPSTILTFANHHKSLYLILSANFIISITYVKHSISMLPFSFEIQVDYFICASKMSLNAIEILIETTKYVYKCTSA